MEGKEELGETGSGGGGEDTEDVMVGESLSMLAWSFTRLSDITEWVEAKSSQIFLSVVLKAS